MTTSEELAHLLFAQLADPNRTESDLTLITRMMDSVTQERDEWQVKARWKHTHDDSLELELQKQLAASQARCAQVEKALKNLVRESQAVADDHHRPRYSRLDESLLSARQALTPPKGRHHDG